MTTLAFPGAENADRHGPSPGSQPTFPSDLSLHGRRIPVGMNVVVPIFHFHWSERFWTEPQRFDPGRFSRERRPPPDATFYFPFSAGPRSASAIISQCRS
jgi:cytochrome P450